MISAMRKKAAKIGANGIILQEIKEASDGAKVAAAVFGVSTNRKGKVIAIRLLTEKKESAINK